MDINETGKIELGADDTALVFRANGQMEFAVGRKLGKERFDTQRPALFFGAAVAGYIADNGQAIIDAFIRDLASGKAEGEFPWNAKDPTS